MPYFQNQIVNGAVGPVRTFPAIRFSAAKSGRFPAPAPAPEAEIQCACRPPCISASPSDSTYQIPFFSPLLPRHDPISIWAITARAPRPAADPRTGRTFSTSNPSSAPPTSMRSSTSSRRSYMNCPSGVDARLASAWNKGIDAGVRRLAVRAVFIPRIPACPLTIKLATDPSERAHAATAPEVTGTPHDPHQIGPGNTWLDVSAYTTPALTHFRSPAARGVVRGPGESRLDLSTRQAIPYHRNKVLRTPRRGLRADEHADLLQPRIADHHLHPVRTYPQFRRRAQCAGGREVLLLIAA